MYMHSAYWYVLEDLLPEACVVVGVRSEQLAGSHQATPLKHLATELTVDLLDLVNRHAVRSEHHH